MLFSSNKSYLGIDIGAGGIKVVELKKIKKRPVLFTYGIASQKQDVHQLVDNSPTNLIANSLEIDNNQKKDDDLKTDFSEAKIDEYANIIKKVCKSAKTVAKDVIVSLPVSSVFHAIVNLPSTIKKEEMDKLVKNEVKKFISYPLAKMSLDYQVINFNEVNSDKKKDIKILVNAVPNKLIAFYTKIFQKVGLSLLALEPESTALTRSLVGIDKATNIIIDIGEERSNLFTITNAIPITHQSIGFGGKKLNAILKNIFKIDDNLIEIVKKDLFFYYLSNQIIKEDDFIKLFESAVEPIVKEINLSLELFYQQLGNDKHRPQKIILTGGSSFMPYFAQYLTNKFDIKTYIGDPWARVVHQQSIRPLLQEIGPRMSVAIGLALRNVV